MIGALLYRPRHKWRMGVAFGTAALIHVTAVALATIHPHDKITDIPFGEGVLPTVTLDPLDPPANDPPPPTPDVTNPPPIPNEESVWEDRSTPPPIRRNKHRSCRFR